MTRYVLFLLALGLGACAASTPPPPSPAPPPAEASPARPARAGGRASELAVIMTFMPGTFDSIAHDKGPGVGTRMRVAGVWEERHKLGEYWFYVEHVRAGEDARPFRQRIYRFTEERGKFAADVFALPADPSEFVGEWRKPKPFERYSPAQLREYRGCRLGVGHMTIQFWARTEGNACRAEDASVAHEFTEMRVGSAGMQYGVRGYDPAGRLVAGEAGIWDFRRMSPQPR